MALLAACAPGDAELRATAEGFWSALRDGDAQRAERLSADPGAARLADLLGPRPLEEVAVERILRDEHTALAETALRPADAETPLRFHTHLVRGAGGGWKVDVARTRRELTRAALDASVEALQESLRRSGEALGERIEEGALEASQALREALEQLERELRNEPLP